MSRAGSIRSGGAYVSIEARDSLLKSGLGKAAGLLGKFAATVGRFASSTVVAATTIARGIHIATNAFNFVDAGSQLHDMALRTGVAVERLSELQYAARQISVEIGVVERAMRVGQRTIGEAANKSFAAQQALSKLGLTYEELAGKGAGEQFEIMAKRLGSIKDPSLRASAALDVFGRSGTHILPLIAEYDHLTERARRLGIVMTSSNADVADRLGDSFVDLTFIGNRLGQIIGATLGPALQVVVDGLVNAGAAVLRWVGDAGELVAITTMVADVFRTTFIAASELVSVAMGAISETVFSMWSQLVDSTGASMQSFSDAIVAGFAVAIYTIQNWGDVSSYVVIGIGLAVVRFGSQVEYFFGTVIPEYLLYLWDNWRNIFQTITDFTASVIGNLANNLYNFFEAIVGWLSGDGFDFTWTGLLEGFESSMGALPSIAEREISGLEKELGDELDALGGKIAEDYEATRERLAKTIETQKLEPPSQPRKKFSGIADIATGIAAAADRLSVSGTFSGAAIGQITGASTVDKQQLDALRQIARNTEGFEQDRFE